MSEASYWFVNTVTVQTYLGETGKGPSYADPQTVACWVEDEARLIRDAAGSEVVSSATVYAPLSAAAQFPPKSKVTTSTRTAFVIACNAFDSGSLDLDLDHVQVSLT